MTPPKQPPHALEVGLPLTTLFNDHSVQLKIKEHTVTVSLDLTGGPKEVQSDPISVGSFDGLPIMAQISFQYDYNVDENELTNHGNDDRTEDQLQIKTFLQSAPGLLADQRVELNAGPNSAGVSRPPTKLWADYAGKNMVLHQRSMDTARRCNEMLVDAAIEAGVSSVVQLGTAPIVTLDNLDDFKRMCGRPVTTDPSADKAAELEEIQHLVGSTYLGTVTWARNNNFANVIGSIFDPKVEGFYTWIGLWKDKCNDAEPPTYCTSRNYFSAEPGRQCSGAIFGGHVIPGTEALSMKAGDPVYIFPICEQHNAIDSSYMQVRYNQTGVKLKYWETA